MNIQGCFPSGWAADDGTVTKTGAAVGGAGLGGAGRMQLNQDLCFVFWLLLFGVTLHGLWGIPDQGQNPGPWHTSAIIFKINHKLIILAYFH